MTSTARTRNGTEGVKLMLLVSLTLASFLLASVPARGFTSGRADFSIEIAGVASPYDVIGAYVLPGELLEIAVVDGGDAEYRLDVPGGRTSRGAGANWTWKAPDEPGLYPLRVTAGASGGSVLVNAFVMVPSQRVTDGRLNGYRIGSYPSEPYRGLEIYLPPRGFVEVTAENREARVSPHFTLGQFLCKQDGGYPKYVVLRPRLLLKLEILVEELNEQGHVCETLSVMSGYRTPYYNEAIGNVTYSQHLYGGAADVFVDERPCDGVMDDLNGDGSVDRDDAGIVCGVVEGMCGDPWYDDYEGGLGAYEKNAVHGPFVHVDVRGFRARW